MTSEIFITTWTFQLKCCIWKAKPVSLFVRQTKSDHSLQCGFFCYPTVISAGNHRETQRPKSSQDMFRKLQKASFCCSSPPVLFASSTMQRSSSKSFSALCGRRCWVRHCVSFFFLPHLGWPLSLGDSAGCDAGSSGGPDLAFSPLLPSSSSSSSAFSSSPTRVLLLPLVCIVLFVSFVFPLWNENVQKTHKRCWRTGLKLFFKYYLNWVFF